MIKAHIGSLLHNSMKRQQPRQPPLDTEVETDSQSDEVDRVVGSKLSSLSDESSLETNFIPEPREETSKYGRKQALVERDNYVSWEEINKFFDTCK